MQENDDDDSNREIYVPFNTMSDLKDTQYLDGIWLDYRGDNELVEKTLRETLAAAHHFRPTDHNAVYVANLCTQLKQFQILSIALQVLLSLVGALTLGIAGIGLMNIMLVAVQQRTREIGVEKALGARRRHILVQFLAEALAITAVGGVAGIASGLPDLCPGGPHHLLQRHGQERRGRRHPPHHLPLLGHRRHRHPRRHRPRQRHDPRHPRRQPRPHRSPPLRINHFPKLSVPSRRWPSSRREREKLAQGNTDPSLGSSRPWTSNRFRYGANLPQIQLPQGAMEVSPGQH